MDAMIFAAGLGTRLRPLTDERPKALVEVGGMPLLELAIRRLRAAGYQRLVINVHHFADQVEQWLEQNGPFGASIAISDERAQLLDTGGGLRHARHHFREDFLVYNVDVLSDIDLAALRRAHLDSGALATLAVRDRPSSRHLLFDASGQLTGWRHNRRGEERICRPTADPIPLAFSGIQMINPGLFAFMPQDETVFSIIDTYLEAGRTRPVLGYRHDADRWLDVGKPPALAEAETLLPKLTFWK